MKLKAICFMLLMLFVLPQIVFSEPEVSWDKVKAIPLDYATIKADKDVRHAIGRTKLTVRIVLAQKDTQGKVTPRTNQDGLVREQLAATVIAAAKYLAQQSGAHMVGVVIDGGYGTRGENVQLARCNYAPDGKGVSGKQDWMWNDVIAADRGLTAKEQKDGGYINTEKVPVAFADGIQAKAPLKN